MNEPTQAASAATARKHLLPPARNPAPPEVSTAHQASPLGRDDVPVRMPPPAEAASQAKAPMTLREAVALSELSAGPSDAEHAARLLHSALDLMQEAGADTDITLPADSLCCLVADLLSGLRSARHNLAVLRETAVRHLDAEDAA